MFNRRQKRLAMLQNIQTTSKTSLKLQCLQLAKGNVKEARELYDYLAEDIASLPDFDPVKPTFLESTKETANGIFEWLKENKDMLAEGYDFIRGIVSKRSAAPKQPLPPIN